MLSTDRTRRRAWMLGALLLTGISAGVAYRAFAQGQPGRPDPQPPFRPFPGAGVQEPRPGFPAPAPFPPPFMGAGAELTATATHVYVLRGNTLYSFDARTLRLVAQTELPMPPPPQVVPQPGGAPGVRPDRERRRPEEPGARDGDRPGVRPEARDGDRPGVRPEARDRNRPDARREGERREGEPLR